MNLILSFVVATLVTAFCLWVALQLTHVEGNFIEMLIVAASGNAVGLALPFLGGAIGGEIGAGIAGSVSWIVVALVMLALITRLTSAYFWPDAVVMVLVANIVGIVCTAFVPGLV